MTALKWQRITDSDGTTIMYHAVAGQPEPRKPFLSYRINPLGINSYGDETTGYMVSLWQGERIIDAVGSIPINNVYGELSLVDAKRAAQQHHDTAGHTLHQL